MSWPLWTAAGVAMMADRLDEAESLLRRSREIAQARLPATEPLQAEIAFRQAELLLRLGRTDEAEECFDAACAIFETLGGNQHPRRRAMATQWAADMPSSRAS